MWTLCTGTRFFGFCSHGFCKHGDSGYFAPLATLLWKMVSGEWRTPPPLFLVRVEGKHYQQVCGCTTKNMLIIMIKLWVFLSPKVIALNITY